MLTRFIRTATHFLAAFWIAGPIAVDADQRTLRSLPHRVTVLELYTSEGCCSCPPAVARPGFIPPKADLPARRRL
jgi:hypothetical protein